MTNEYAFVGDVHGDYVALRHLWNQLAHVGVEHTVFLGDYVNKGPQSAEVLSLLSSLFSDGSVTLLRGNHEAALLEAVQTRDLARFLKMGGAATIRSYVGRAVQADVWRDFVEEFPQDHLELIQNMPVTFEVDQLIARHVPDGPRSTKYLVSAHRFAGLRPRIGHSSAQIDTGCGNPGGRLTAFLWPSRDYLQVDINGRVVS